MATNLIDQILKTAVDQSLPVKLTLRDGSTVSLNIKEFDGYVALVAGDPDYLLYRHSILEVDAGPAHGPRRAEGGRPSRSEGKAAVKPGGGPRKTARPKQQRKPKREQAGPRDRQPRQEVGKSNEPAFGNTLADKLKAWQDTHKEGE